MCTLIALHRCVPDLPLVVAANRDEYLDRPSEPPALRDGVSGPVVAPRDAREGGTWLGVNRARMFAGITNRPAAVRHSDRRSRGLLLMDALGFDSAVAAAEALERIPVGAYNPFNLLVADAESAWVAWRVHRALEVLTEHERPLIELAYWRGLSQSEIADRLGIPLGTVKTRTRSALARLADELDGELS